MLGPTTIYSGDRYGAYYSKRVGYTHPFGEERTPTPHDFYEVTLGENQGWATLDLPNLSSVYYMNVGWGRGSGSEMGDVSNKARDRFFSKVHGDVQGLVNLAEYRQSWSTLAALLGALRRPTQALEAAFRKYQKAHNNKSSESLLMTALRDSSDGWLAWHFGVEPLLKDVLATCDILVNGTPRPRKVSGSAKGNLVYHTELKTCTEAKTSYGYDETYLLRCKLRAHIEITNPNLWLANSLGLLNLPAVAWELVPWSFAFDWVFNIGAFVNSLSDEMGIELTNATTTRSCHAKGSRKYVYYNLACTSYPPRLPTEKFNSVNSYRWQRELSLVGVRLNTIKTAPWSLTRISTAVALVIQKIPRS